MADVRRREAPTLLLTCGDPAGIGPEVVCKAWAATPAHDRARLRVVVDPDVLGGLVVRVDDTVYDQSVATSLVRLGDRLKQRSIRAIQNREFKWEA